MSCILDTNIVSAILKKNQIIAPKIRQLRITKQQLFISCITYYEIKGGLVAANATAKLLAFERLCNNDLKIVFLDDRDILDVASDIYADLKRKGTPLETADILIAATAIARDLVLVSHDSDMLRIPGLALEDWLRPER